MQRLAIGVLIGAGLVMLANSAFSTPDAAYAHHGVPHAAGSELIALPTQLADGKQQLTVIDPTARVISVYHISPTSGELALKSVRNIHWDLQMTQFNGTSPLPQELRSLVEQK